jgi:hypothetical protein
MLKKRSYSLTERLIFLLVILLLFMGVSLLLEHRLYQDKHLHSLEQNYFHIHNTVQHH